MHALRNDHERTLQVRGFACLDHPWSGIRSKALAIWSKFDRRNTCMCTFCMSYPVYNSAYRASQMQLSGLFVQLAIPLEAASVKVIRPETAAAVTGHRSNNLQAASCPGKSRGIIICQSQKHHKNVCSLS